MNGEQAARGADAGIHDGLCRIAFTSISSPEGATRERRHAAARALLEKLAPHVPRAPRDLDAGWEEGEFGKPRLAGGPQFSFSYSGHWVVVAVSDEPVRIDVERIRPLRLGNARLVLTPSEQEHVQLAANRDEALLRIWTRKEAVSKAAGLGMHAAFTEMEALEAGRVSLAGRFWHVVDVQGPPGTLVSLATASSTSVRVEFAPEGDLEPSP